MMVDLTVDRVRELLDYDQETGVFTWRANRGGHAVIGKRAGSVKSGGYVYVTIDGRYYRAHRLAWMHVYGVWPKNQLDHINRVPSDNRLSNLREATGSENKQNTGRYRNNTSGFKGVGWHELAGKWRARIAVNNNSRYLGLFDTPEEAYAAYRAEAERLHSRNPATQG